LKNTFAAYLTEKRLIIAAAADVTDPSIKKPGAWTPGESQV
jgi:hypothetical protein